MHNSVSMHQVCIACPACPARPLTLGDTVWMGASVSTRAAVMILRQRQCSCMQAVSEAIVKGNCMNAEAIARVVAEAGYEFDSYSTCGMTAEAIKVA